MSGPAPNPGGFSLRRLFSNASSLVAGSAASTLLSFATGVLLARALGPAVYGLWGVLVALGGVWQSFLSGPTSTPLTRHLVLFRERDDRDGLALLLASALALELAFGVASCLAMVGAALAGADQDLPQAAVLIYAFSLLAGFPEKVWMSVMRDQRRFRAIGMLPVATAALNLVLVGAFWRSGRLDLLTLALARLVCQTMVGAVTIGGLAGMLPRYGVTLSRLPYRQVVSERGQLAEMWSFMRTMYVSTCFSSLVKQGDVLILGYFRPAAEVGYYRLGKSVTAAIARLLGSLGNVVYQDFNELLARGQVREMRRGLRRLNRFWPALVSVGVLLVIGAAPWLIVGLYGDEFAPAVLPLRILAVGAGLTVILFWSPTLMLSLGLHRRYLLLQSSIVGVSLLLMLAGAGWRGAVGLSIAVSLMWAVLLGVVTVECLRALDRRAAEEPSAEQPEDDLADGVPS